MSRNRLLTVGVLLAPAFSLSGALAQHGRPAPTSAPALPVVVVDRDDVTITESCQLEIRMEPIVDANGDGVVHVVGDGVLVLFPETPLHGAAPGADPDTFTGTGVRITGTGATIRGARIHGFRVAVHATGADRLTVERCDLSDNFRQRLRSTPWAEDAGDWLRPHENDDNEWLRNYGAAVYVEDARTVTVRDNRVRRGQNGIVFDRVNDSRIFDNDCSFLSGWGVALWRSSRNVISHNALDFCVRGYSHTVYNRGQDSAGILFFEQCSDNYVTVNSATHGGDGFFGFAGREALGEVNPHEDESWYDRRGNNGNVLTGNDFSYAAAHGIEMTFSFDNVFFNNRLVRNAICGIWGGYSQDTIIAENLIERNGLAGSGEERGGINIEHGRGNRIARNTFRRNACGVHLWWDEDAGLLGTPWSRRNHERGGESFIDENNFVRDALAIQLRALGGPTRITGNRMSGVAREIEADAESPILTDPGEAVALAPAERSYFGATRPIGARARLKGRDHIVMTEWGPYDWETPLVLCVERGGGEHVYRVLGVEDEAARTPVASGPVTVEVDGDRVSVRPEASEEGAVAYELSWPDLGHGATDSFLPLRWKVRLFPWRTDPREDARTWRQDAEKSGVTVTVETLDLSYGTGGPSDLPVDGLREAGLPSDRFGTLASTEVELPAGRWRIRTTSDDGIRVKIDGITVIDDWTWHPPKDHEYEFRLKNPKRLRFEVEHFELDGFAVLKVEIERAP